jgi:hypothetical protein
MVGLLVELGRAVGNLRYNMTMVCSRYGKIRWSLRPVCHAFSLCKGSPSKQVVVIDSAFQLAKLMQPILVHAEICEPRF